MSNAWLDARRREEEWPVRLLIGKDLPAGAEDLAAKACRLVVTAGLRWPPGHSGAHFWVASELVDRAKHRREWLISGEPQHELVLKYLPELEPVVRLHGLDVDAVAPADADEAIDRLLELGAKDNRVATAAQHALVDQEPRKPTITDRLDHLEHRPPGEPPGIAD